MFNSDQLIAGLRKASQAIVIWLIVFGIIAVIEPSALRVVQLWILCGIGVLANIFQPSYNPFEKSRTPEDRGTAVQILWTVYGVQILAVSEFLLRRPVLHLNILTALVIVYILSGLGLRTWAVTLLGRWFTWNVDVQDGQEIIQSGPYSYIRHPSYTGAFMMFTGAPLLLGSFVSFAIAVIALFIAFRRRIFHEESLLLNALPGYAAYRTRTGALFPRFNPISKVDVA